MKIILLVSMAVLVTPKVLCSVNDTLPNGDQEIARSKIIEPFKMAGEAWKFKMEIKNGGILSYNGQDIGTLKSDGIVLGKDGKELARLKPDGTAVTRDGKSIGKILANGDIKVGPDTKGSWVNGKLKLEDDGPTIVLKPDKPESRRWGSFLLLLQFTPVPNQPLSLIHI